MQSLISAMQGNIKEIGADKWKLKCPVHNDKDYAMYVSHKGDGSIVGHCFACGANGYDLYKTLGLPFDELFGKSDRPHISNSRKQDNFQDKIFMKIYECDEKEGKQLSEEETNQYKNAIRRTNQFESAIANNCTNIYNENTMASINKVILIGNLGKDPEVRPLSSGDSVANISIATTDSWKDKQSGQMQERTEWHRVVFFKRLAEIVGQYLKKGSQVYIEGRLQTKKWQDKEGNDRYTTEIVADVMKMLGSKADDPVMHKASASQKAAEEYKEEDVPF